MDATPSGEIIRAFLLDPDSKRNQRAFAEVCAQIALGYIEHRLKQFGETGLESADRRKTHGDLAHAALTSLCGDKPSTCPFPVVFDFFRNQGISDPASEDPRQLYHLLTVLLRSKIKQYLHHSNRENIPQLRTTGRGLKDILDKPPYRSVSHSGGTDWVTSDRSGKGPRADKEPIPDATLREIVENAYFHAATTRTAWCAAIFEGIAAMHEYQNVVSKPKLLRTMLAVEAENFEVEAPLPVPLGNPAHDFECKRIEICTEKVVRWLNAEEIPFHVRKRRITADEGTLLAEMFKNYVDDVVANGHRERLPAYFREVFPSETHDRYLTHYKYVMETVMSKALARLGDCLSK